MATAAEVTKSILGKLLVRQSEAPLEADEFQDTIFALNNYMTAQAANGINLGYTIVSNLADTITVPAGALQGIISNVAIEMAPDFGMTASAELIRSARLGLRAMRNLGTSLNSTQLPSTLPIGSGNEGDFFNSDHFFPGTSEDLLTETGNNIGLESGT